MTDIQRLYQDSIGALEPWERIARSVAMLHWSRNLIARQVLAGEGAMDAERLKWEVAMRMYGADMRSREMIQRQLDRVSN